MLPSERAFLLTKWQETAQIIDDLYVDHYT